MTDAIAHSPPWPHRWRSALFVPGDDAHKLAKAAAGDADAVIIDLEDGVAAATKAAARQNIAIWTQRLKESGRDVVVRINSAWREVFADLDAIGRSAVDAVMVPKVEGRARLDVLAELLDEFGVDRAAVGIVALIESPTAFACLADIAGMPRVAGLALGSEDYAMTLGVEPTPECLELPCRMLAMAAPGRSVLAAPLSIAQFRDRDAVRHAYAQARQMGISGALCIHPAQVEIANQTFAVPADEIAEARKILAAWHQAEARHEAVISVDGRMIDKPVAARLQRLIDRR